MTTKRRSRKNQPRKKSTSYKKGRRSQKRKIQKKKRGGAQIISKESESLWGSYNTLLGELRNALAWISHLAETDSLHYNLGDIGDIENELNDLRLKVYELRGELISLGQDVQTCQIAETRELLKEFTEGTHVLFYHNVAAWSQTPYSLDNVPQLDDDHQEFWCEGVIIQQPETIHVDPLRDELPTDESSFLIPVTRITIKVDDKNNCKLPIEERKTNHVENWENLLKDSEVRQLPKKEYNMSRFDNFINGAQALWDEMIDALVAIKLGYDNPADWKEATPTKIEERFSQFVTEPNFMKRTRHLDGAPLRKDPNPRQLLPDIERIEVLCKWRPRLWESIWTYFQHGEPAGVERAGVERAARRRELFPITGYLNADEVVERLREIDSKEKLFLILHTYKPWEYDCNQHYHPVHIKKYSPYKKYTYYNQYLKHVDLDISAILKKRHKTEFELQCVQAHYFEIDAAKTPLEEANVVFLNKQFTWSISFNDDNIVTIYINPTQVMANSNWYGLGAGDTARPEIPTTRQFDDVNPWTRLLPIRRRPPPTPKRSLKKRQSRVRMSLDEKLMGQVLEERAEERESGMRRVPRAAPRPPDDHAKKAIGYCKAKHDNKAEKPDELAFEKGEMLEILSKAPLPAQWAPMRSSSYIYYYNTQTGDSVWDPCDKEWAPVRSKTGDYYYNNKTGESVWEHPCEEHQDQEGEWWLCRNNKGREGLVPANYVREKRRASRAAEAPQRPPRPAPEEAEDDASGPRSKKSFIAGRSFRGRKEGYEFKSGAKGTGCVDTLHFKRGDRLVILGEGRGGERWLCRNTHTNRPGVGWVCWRDALMEDPLVDRLPPV